MKRQWNILITGSWLDDMENSEIFKIMKRQWNILITGSRLDGMKNSEIFKTMKRIQKTMEHSDHWIMTGWQRLFTCFPVFLQ
jgi:hypothetical protein